MLDLLRALVDKSLVQSPRRGRGARYRMLETIREYGADRAEEAGELGGSREATPALPGAAAGSADPQLRGPDQLPG